MNIFYYSGVDPSNPAAGLRYDGSLYQRSPGLCSPAGANTLMSSTPVMAAPYGPAAGGRGLDLVVAPSTVVSLLPPQVQTNFCASAAYRMKTPYVIWPKLFRSRDRVNKSVKCEVCDMVLNSEQQARQHFNGKHHLRRMRKMKLDSSASEDKCSADSKRSCYKLDSTGKKIRLKKRHDNRVDEEPTTEESIADVSSNGDPTANEEEEEPVSRDEEISKSPGPRYKTDEANQLRLEYTVSSEHGTTPVIFRRLENPDSAEQTETALDLGKLNNADFAEKPASSSPSDLSASNNGPSSTNSCTVSSRTNCDLVQSHCQAGNCSSLSCTALNRRCYLPQNTGMSTASSSCYCSPLLHDALSQSSLSSSHMMPCVSSSFKWTTGQSMTASLDYDILSQSATPFVPGSPLPRP